MISSIQATTQDNTSGLGSQTVVPPEIRRWNWGAFFWGWIWGLCHNTPLALLTLVPVVNVVMLFVLGAQGSEWAWRNKHWESVEQFRRVQRKWGIWGLVLWIGSLLAIVGFGLSIFFAATALLKSSDPYHLALEKLHANTQAMQVLGEPVETGIPTGSLHTSNGTGSAEMSFSVQGTQKKGVVYLSASKKGVWRLEDLELNIDGEAAAIDLLPEKPLKKDEYQF